jgi:hypothetical protein
MRSERWLLRLGEYLVGRACRRLPGKVRAARYREWTAELPAILHDPHIRFGWHRAARMLRYAAGTSWGAAALAPAAARRLKNLVTASIAVQLACLAFGLWVAVKAAAYWVNYLLALLPPSVYVPLLIWLYRRRRDMSRGR